MNSSYPFVVDFINGATYDSPEQMYRISADFAEPALSRYRLLFDKYKTDNRVISLVEVTANIIEENYPDLLDHLDFDEEGYLLDVHADSEEAVQNFISTVCTTFQDLDQLDRYVRRIATADE